MFPDPKVRIFPPDGDYRIYGDVLVASDWHMPFHDLTLAEYLLDVRRTLGIEHLIIPGDLLDATALSSYDKLGLEHSIKEELMLARDTLGLLSRHFKKIYWSPGNHENRLLRRFDFALTLPDVIELLTPSNVLPEVESIELPQFTVISNGQKFRITHPKSYSIVPMKIASELADIFHCHVMSAHGHHMGVSYSKSGKYLGIDLGGMFDVEKVPYINLGGDTTHPRWNPGFWAITHGIPQPFNNQLTNWKLYEINGYTQV